LVAFKKMWEDVGLIISKEECSDVKILEKFNYGFTVKELGNTIFITRYDFVDFWCKLLYYNELSLEQVLKEDKSKLKYIYTIIKQLPYISESCGVIKLIQ